MAAAPVDCRKRRLDIEDFCMFFSRVSKGRMKHTFLTVYFPSVNDRVVVSGYNQSYFDLWISSDGSNDEP
jgi:hypothetical protein